MSEPAYVHGYSNREFERLEDQANCLEDLLHKDSIFEKGSIILEAGCGTGAQTKIIASKNPESKIISIDISESSVRKAQELIDSLNIKNVEFRVADIFHLPFEDGSFDHIIVCFVLEHILNPGQVLGLLKNKLRPGGSITVIEGDHGSAYFHPPSKYAEDAIKCQIDLQSAGGGNALIGRQLFPLLKSSGFRNCSVSPRMVYVDSSRPLLAEGFIKNTFTAMIEGIKTSVIENDLMDESEFDKGIEDLYRTASEDGVFCYCFFKGTGYC